MSSPMLMLLVHVGILLGTVFVAIYIHFRRRYTYWERKKVPHEPPVFPFGNLRDSRKKALGVMLRELYEKNKDRRFYGLYFINKPTLVINDLDLIKDILVRDFSSFQDHGVYHDEKLDPLSAHLFAIEGATWRNRRVKMTPTFTSGKMKMMFRTVKDCGDQLVEVLRKPARDGEVVEVKDLAARFGTDVISSCAFGIESNSLKNPNAAFRVMGRQLFESTWSSFLRNTGTFVAPDCARILKIRAVPKKFSDFFMGALRETIKFRSENNVKRNDFLQLLIQLMNQGYVDKADHEDEPSVERQKFTFDQAASEAFVFFLGGFETTGAFLHFLLYEMAVNPEVQEKLREEIRTVLAESDGEVTYENMLKMEYLERVIHENLRKHCPVYLLSRVCTKPYRIPDTDIVLEKGTSVTIPVIGIHMDERYYPNPEKFDPDRFTEEEKAKRNSFTFLAFGDGPRVCIGQRFAMMQLRIAIISIFANYRVEFVDGKTPSRIEYDPKLFVASAKGGMPLRFTALGA